MRSGIARRLAVLLVAGTAFAPLAAPLALADDAAPETTLPAPVIAPDMATFTLANGLQVVVIPDHRAPVVTHMIWYKAGAADEPPGKSGIAHFLEHLMFKGTKDHPGGAFSDTVASIGGEENAFTSNDYTAYFQQVAKDDLKLMMGFEADRMANLVLTDKVLKPEKQVVLQERAMRMENDPGAELSEALDAALYVTHPYAIPVIGWRPEIEKLQAKDALAFYDRFYTPNNAVVVVAGDITPEEVKRLAEETYGKVARRADPGDRVRPSVPHLAPERIVKLVDERVSQPTVQQQWLVPSRRTATDNEAAALTVLAELVGGGSTSRLYDKLVRNDGPATSAGAFYQGGLRDAGRFVVYAAPRDGLTPEAAEKALDQVIATVADKGVSADEVNRAKRSLVADSVYAQDNQGTLARIFGAGLSTGLSIDQIRSWPSRIAAVSPADVQAVARKYLVPGDEVTGLLLPPPGAKPQNGGAVVPHLSNQEG